MPSFKGVQSFSDAETHGRETQAIISPFPVVLPLGNHLGSEMSFLIPGPQLPASQGDPLSGSRPCRWFGEDGGWWGHPVSPCEPVSRERSSGPIQLPEQAKAGSLSLDAQVRGRAGACARACLLSPAQSFLSLTPASRHPSEFD